MAFLKKFYKLPASSLLESVIALCIISICLYIAVLIFAAVFTSRTAAKFYTTQNKVNALFFMAQLNDSLASQNEDKNLIIEEEYENSQLKKIDIQYKDSTQFKFEKSFYVQDY